MTGTTLEELLQQAESLALQAVREAEARCAVLGQYVSDCESRGARTAAWSDAVRELRSLQDHRAGLKRRHSLIRQALEYPTGESPATVALPAQPSRTAGRTRRMIQIRVRRQRG